MKKALIYGKPENFVPWYEGFCIDAEGNIDLQLKGVDFIEVEDKKEIRWIDLYTKDSDKLLTEDDYYHIMSESRGDVLAPYYHCIERIFDRLRLYCNAQVEKSFFDLYCGLSLCDYHMGAFLPALIPHVYVNWFSSKEERANKSIPYIVDFVLKSSKLGTDNLVIVEIDGFSHYSKYDHSLKVHIASEEVYACHLKKDRWLRKQGFNVIRIGNDEINSILSLEEEEKRLKKFYYFFREVFGNMVFTEEDIAW